MYVIKEFIDNSKIIFDKGEFDEYCIYYQENQNGKYKINMIFLLKRIEGLINSNKSGSKDINNILDIRKIFRKDIYGIRNIDSFSIEQLDKFISQYNFTDDLLLIKVSYMVLAMYYAEDNHPGTILFRTMFRHAISRVIDGENANIVSEDYHNRHVEEIQKMIRDYDNRRWTKKMGNTCGW